MSLDVEVRNVEKHYGDFTALQPTSLHVKNGEFLTILGPSGSGKTTLLKIISGFETPSSGDVLIGSENVTFSPPHKRGIGMVFQNYALFPHMTVYDNICFPLKMRKVSKDKMKEKALEALELVQLTKFKDRYPSQLSGGQRQRVALARAVVFDPPVLLLDEPLGALDKQLRVQMQLEIKKLQEKLKITTVSVTHDQEEALTMSTRICIINNGQIEQLGTPREIYEHPNNRFVAEFIGETNLIDAQIVGWEEEIAIIKTNKGELLRAVTLNKELKNVTIAIRPELISIVSPEEPGDNMLRVVVQDIVYLGDSSRCQVITEKGEYLKIKLSPKEIPFVREGQELMIGWEVNQGVLIH
ncbi:ABC transporter ATP-binding protein [Microaerobacter geothermalis]|uniref:ABC transporter ATP-binding protein n=1 Tax=Microaerobacter geothermalis TaxID=674972 RepID=UPI001F2C7995|nr:ABC transporter ATP-binding protein [Microaerobacter geothermalis]MCF6093675.1 ABC transporter ATP-binding protein [Microaerobacter geothermalis]